MTRAHKPERLVLVRSCVLVACITSSSTALLGLGSPSNQALWGLCVLEAKEYGRTRRTSAEILVVFQMRTTQLCRAVWLLKPCVSLSTDGIHGKAHLCGVHSHIVPVGFEYLPRFIRQQRTRFRISVILCLRLTGTTDVLVNFFINASVRPMVIL